MIYVAVIFTDEDQFAFECSDILMDTNHIRVLDEDGKIRDVIPYANLKYASIISEEEYNTILEENNDA